MRECEGLRGDSYLSTCLTREFFGTASTTTSTAFGGIVYDGARRSRCSRHGAGGGEVEIASSGQGRGEGEKVK
jgi:hypothetical protein